MFRYRVLNSKLNLIQTRVLGLVSKGSETEYEKLMKNTLTTQQHSLQLLMNEIYKMTHCLNPTFMRDVFAERSIHYNLRKEHHLQLPVTKTITYGIENTEYRGCLLMSTLHKEIDGC